jgi:DNA uptake protein ComE-like DNA-binding protein
MALLLTLWFIVLLAGLSGVGLGEAKRANLQARNRMALIRAGWAREACLEVIIERAQADSMARLNAPVVLTIDSLDLGDALWCSTRTEDPDTRLNLNTGSTESLTRLFGDSTLMKVVVDGRPWFSTDQLPEPLRPWSAFLTVRGTGRVNLLSADATVLGALALLGKEGAQQITRVRSRVRIGASLEELLGQLDGTTVQRIRGGFDQFVRETTTQSLMLVVDVRGHTGERPIVARETVTLLPADHRLAVARREVE